MSDRDDRVDAIGHRLHRLRGPLVPRHPPDETGVLAGDLVTYRARTAPTVGPGVPGDDGDIDPSDSW